MLNQPDNNPAPAQELDQQVQRELEEALAGQSIEHLMESAAAIPPATPQPAEKNAARTEPKRFVHEMARGRISSIRGDDVFVELTGIEGKNQGVVPLLQFERPPRLGSIMDFVVQRIDQAEGLVILSREGAVSRATWELLQKGAIVEGRVIATNKGGLELELIGGIRAFIPASQIDLHHTDNMAQYVGKKIQGVVQEIEHRSKKVVLSRRHLLEQERRRNQQKTLEEIQPGQLRDGKVSSLTEYGAFVDLGGVDGLIHVSDLSYSRVDKPSDMLKVGETLKVKVLKVDKEKNRIGLGLKQVAPDPWEGIQARIHQGQTVTGKILRTADFGAFVELFPGVEGLLPISELSWKRIHKTTDAVKEGDSLRMAVISIEPDKRRLTLSLKKAGPDPWIGASHKYAKYALVDAVVLSTPDFGAFVELETGVEALVHISELAGHHVNAVTDVLQVGQKHQFRVLEVDEDNRRARLSLKAVKELPREEAPSKPGADDHAPSKASPKPPAKRKQRDSNLKGGMEGASLGIGLGNLKL